MILSLKGGQRFQPVYNEVLIQARSVKHCLFLSLKRSQRFQPVYNEVLIKQGV